MPQQDATMLLDADHNEVAGMFAQYKAAHDDARKALLAARIAHALTVHMKIEEEIFYPAFRQATGDDSLLKEAQCEHDEARALIARIQAARSDAKLMLELEDAIQHHVNDEREKMFPKARATRGLDLMRLAAQLEARKAELTAAQPA